MAHLCPVLPKGVATAMKLATFDVFKPADATSLAAYHLQELYGSLKTVESFGRL